MQRNCRERAALPICGDWIEVLWEMDSDAVVWWKAQVLEVDEMEEQGVLAAGTVEYVPYKDYLASEEKVEFLPGRLVRIWESSEYVNNNPSLSWRTCSIDPTKLVQNEDGPWDSRITQGGEKISTGDHGKQEDVVLTAVKKQVELLVEEVKCFRDSNANLLTELEIVKNRVNGNTQKIEDVSRPALDPSCERVMSFLRHRMAVLLQKPPPKKKIRISPSRVGSHTRTPRTPCRPFSLSGDYVEHIDPIGQSFAKVTADCDLGQFELLARLWYVRSHANNSTSTNEDQVRFFPSYESTQCASLSTEVFYVSFKSFGALCDCLQLNSTSDRLAMVKKEAASGPRGKLLRVLGTYVYNPENNKQPCALFVGKSCGGSMKRPRENEAGETQHGAVKVLLRDSREWSVEDKRFLHPLRVAKRIPTAIEDPTAVSDDSARQFGFRATWRRAQAVRTRTWSANLSNASQVLGVLEVSVPFIQCEGNVLTNEFNKCLSDEVLEESVK